jgi:hypothetical protein
MQHSDTLLTQLDSNTILQGAKIENRKKVWNQTGKATAVYSSTPSQIHQSARRNIEYRSPEFLGLRLERSDVFRNDLARTRVAARTTLLAATICATHPTRYGARPLRVRSRVQS